MIRNVTVDVWSRRMVKTADAFIVFANTKIAYEKNWTSKNHFLGAPCFSATGISFSRNNSKSVLYYSLDKRIESGCSGDWRFRVRSCCAHARFVYIALHRSVCGCDDRPIVLQCVCRKHNAVADGAILVLLWRLAIDQQRGVRAVSLSNL